MNSDNFLIFSITKNKVTFWRTISAILLFILLLCVLDGSGISIFKEDVDNYSYDYIAKVKIDGPINSETFDEKKLKSLENNSDVKAVILEINSPGGEVVPSEILYNSFKKIAQKKPVVTTIKNMGASGAYLVALASEYIVAYNTSLIGSIGVLIQSTNITSLLNKTGIDVKLYKSSKLKASPNLFEYADEDVEMILKEELNEIYDYFLNVFVENRKLDIKDAMELANGQVYVGRQAVNFGLIDKIGDTSDLLVYLKSKGIETSDVFDYDIGHKEKNFLKKILYNIYRK